MDPDQDEEHRLTIDDVRTLCDAPEFVRHYRDALSKMGLWKSEEILAEQCFDRNQRILDLGCGAGRVAFGLWDLGFRQVEGIDLAPGMIEVAREHAAATGRAVPFDVGNALKLPHADAHFGGVIFGFGGLMQIPGRASRRAAMREIWRILRPGGVFIFTTHDRAMEEYRTFWKDESGRPLTFGTEFGDVHEEGPHGMVFVHVPDRKEIEEDLAATGWMEVQTFLRSDIAEEEDVVEELSDPCRFWLAGKLLVEEVVDFPIE